MSLFSKLRKQLNYLDKPQLKQVEKAFLFAEKAHEGQKRSSGEPYITHPVTVAGILAAMQLDYETIMAALMHDVMEDTSIDKAVIAEQFGDAVATLVDGVSKLTQIKFATKAEAQAENFRKMVLAMAKDIRVIIVKLADRLHNMQTLGVLRPEKRRRIAKETLDVYVPLSNRLGMHTIRVELENLCFEGVYPERYRVLDKAIKHLQGNRKNVLGVIEKAIKTQLAKAKLSSFQIVGREKNLYSIYCKMRDKRTSLSDIMDVYAFRIIVDSDDDCYRALGLMHKLYKPVSERFKDYIAIPKANGYQSLHTTLFGPYGVPIEIQIRTRKMQQTAERGVAAHWRYKQNKKTIVGSDERTQAWLDRLLDLQKSAASTREFVENVKGDLLPDEVYVFTPEGEIIELPKGATVIDFAYEIHTDIGNHCGLAKVDRRYVPLSTQLSNGQTVEVITTKTTSPRLAWLDYVVTAKARSNIRHFLKQQRHSESIKLGEELLNKALASLGSDYRQLPRENIGRVLHQSRFKDEHEMFAAISGGHYNPILLAKRLLATEDPNIEAIHHISEPLTIKGVEGMLMHFPNCCRPIPGDTIIGYLEHDYGVVVHSINCHHVASYAQEPDKYIPLTWDDAVQGEFEVSVVVQVYNDKGVLALLANQLAGINVNIQDVRVLEKNNEYGRMAFLLTLHNRGQLAQVMRTLRKVKSVIRVERELL